MTVMNITEIPTYEDAGFWYQGLGWYFLTESEDLVGPYKTKQTAEERLKDYIIYL